MSLGVTAREEPPTGRSISGTNQSCMVYCNDSTLWPWPGWFTLRQSQPLQPSDRVGILVQNRRCVSIGQRKVQF